MTLHVSIFYGSVINPVSLTKYEALPKCLLAVGPDGAVIWLEQDVPEHLIRNTLAHHGLVDVKIDLVVLKHGEFIIPGFVDTHTHAPQFPNTGRGQQYKLLDWLKYVTFPMEKQFADENLDFAQRTYDIVVRRTIDLGTTTCCYYGTLHLEATKILVDIAHACGQRAFVGKCNMDIDRSPEPSDYVEKDAQHSEETTKQLIKYIRELESNSCHPKSEPLVKPILTPRFALSCTRDLLLRLRKLADSDPTLHIQTHISENRKEIEATLEAFPEARSYADVYDIYGLLRHNTVLAHGVHLGDDEIELIKERKAGISHCPVSNFNLQSGIAPIGKYLDHGLKVGLGTDISGGISPSMLTVIQQASVASKVVALQSTDQDSTTTGFANHQLSVAALFYLATMGGAQVCDIDKQVGSFAPGKSFDALLVSVRPETEHPIIWTDDVGSHTADVTKELLDLYLERFLFGGDDRNILRTYVQGRFIGGKSFKP
ncbi:hypothetical protein JOM56_003298 [Amanita muscaria]